MDLIDTHSHIYLDEFEADRNEMLDKALKANVGAILMPAIDATTHEAMLELAKNSNNCFSMMGLHPCSVKEDYLKELEIVKDYLAKMKFIAVGEIGLDFYWDKTYSREQYLAFKQQIEWALEYNLPISIHSRNATDECIEVVKAYPGIRGVFHCFSGTYEQAREVQDIGFLMGIGGVVTFKNSGLDKVLEKTGMEHIILETDAPYLAPVPFRGKRNEPSYLSYVVSKLAGIYNTTEEKVVEMTTNNAMQLFNL
ncbi:MAG TPA: TatD family hydrolase [Flavisolibacter sp.]|nr:TatD family hydrolase [Flavisolibacter sp.]